jgi:hypothetical protein
MSKINNISDFEIYRIAQDVQIDLAATSGKDGQQNVYIDPMLAVGIANLIVGVIRICIPLAQKYCGKKKGAGGIIEACKKPKLWHRILLRWKIRRVLRQPEFRGLKDKINQEDIAHGIFRRVSKASQEEVGRVVG